MSSDGDTPLPKKDDSFTALVILVLAVVVVVAGLAYSWSNKKKAASVAVSIPFKAPVERSDYIKAKETLDLSNPDEIETLKKLLMKRALKVIPMLINYQNEGQSIERLYKRGMLTDDMHYKVKELKEFFDKEFQDVKNEADELVEGWGAYIWEQANYFSQNINQKLDEKNNGGKTAEEEKRKAKREKEKAKKQLQKSLQRGDSDSSLSGSKAVAVDPEVLKAQEVERLAQQLIEEEEQRKKKNAAKKSVKSQQKK